MSESVLDRRIRLLQAAAQQFKSLLDDPYPGLATWMIAVAQVRREIDDIMDGKLDERAA